MLSAFRLLGGVVAIVTDRGTRFSGPIDSTVTRGSILLNHGMTLG